MAASEGVVIGIETQLDAKGDVKLLKEINSPGIKIYFKFQNALENGRDLCKELKILGKKEYLPDSLYGYRWSDSTFLMNDWT